ncbi:hypothetical protein X975_17779, partial [Stegodyphus mimosarum]
MMMAMVVLTCHPYLTGLWSSGTVELIPDFLTPLPILPHPYQIRGLFLSAVHLSIHLIQIAVQTEGAVTVLIAKS